MTNIHINRKELNKYLGKNIGDDVLRRNISMMGTDVEKIDKEEIVTEIFPNRPDLLSFYGFSRALSAFMGIKPGMRMYKVKRDKSDYRVIVDDSVKDIRPHTRCAIVKNLNLDDNKIKDIIDMQEKLHMSFGRNRKRVAIGIYPLDKIDMPITYKALPPEKIIFRPLESDKEMNGREIIEKHPKGKEYKHLLEGKDKFPIFIDKKGNILSMPPIINSHETGKVDENTKEVFIECSGYNEFALSQALNIILSVLADMGGEIYEMTIEYGDKKIVSPDMKPREIEVNMGYIEKTIGSKINDISELLGRMGMTLKEKKGDNLIILYPPYRTDILHPIDIVEDVAIAYGYDNINPEMPKISGTGEEDKLEVFKRKLAYIMTGLGLMETNTFHLVPEGMQDRMMNIEIETIKVSDSRTENNTLRAWIIPSLMDVLRNNAHNEYPQKIFEIGGCFKGLKDFQRMGCLIAPGNYTEAKQILEYLFGQLGVKSEYMETNHGSFIEGRVARVAVNGKKIAYVGEINPEVITNFSLDVPVSGFELNVSELFEIITTQ